MILAIYKLFRNHKTSINWLIFNDFAKKLQSEVSRGGHFMRDMTLPLFSPQNGKNLKISLKIGFLSFFLLGQLDLCVNTPLCTRNFVFQVLIWRKTMIIYFPLTKYWKYQGNIISWKSSLYFKESILFIVEYWWIMYVLIICIPFSL